MRESEQHKQDMLEDDGPKLEKHDETALMLSGLITIGLPCLLLILLIMGVTLFLFGR